ncbi:hypothetical protein [Carnobacterium divergens]|uniref:hypothetical protein n=1 Tax=Carnobacterium divergens TaxID=2748 RepID=UPI0039B0176B
MIVFLKETWKIIKENKYAILLILLILFILSYIVGIGVKIFPNFGTYGSASEWFGFWGNVVGGIISTLIAAGIAYFVTKNENEKNNLTQMRLRNEENNEQERLRAIEKEEREKLQKRTDEREEKIIKETAIMKLKLNSVENCLQCIAILEEKTKDINYMFEKCLNTFCDYQTNEKIIISKLKLIDSDKCSQTRSAVELIVNRINNTAVNLLIEDSNISSFYFSRFSEYLSNLVALAQTIINEIGKLESTNVSQSYNKSDINTQEDDIEYYKDMYYDYSKILANLRTELIQIVQNL